MELFYARWFRNFITLVAVMHMALAVIEPASNLNPLASQAVVKNFFIDTRPIEAFILLCYVCDIALKVRFMGFRNYLRSWNILELACTVIFALDLVIPNGSMGGLQFSRVLRPAFVVTKRKHIRFIFTGILHSLPPMLPVLLLMGFTVIAFASTSTMIFSASVPAFAGLHTNGTATPPYCSVFSRGACENYFGSFTTSLYSLLVLVARANWPLVMLPFYSRTEWAGLWFFGFLLIAHFFLWRLLLAVSFASFADHCREKYVLQQKRSRAALKAAFSLLSSRGYLSAAAWRSLAARVRSSQKPEVVDTIFWAVGGSSGYIDAQAFVAACSLLDLKATRIAYPDTRSSIGRWRRRTEKLVSSAWVAVGSDVVIVLVALVELLVTTSEIDDNNLSRSNAVNYGTSIFILALLFLELAAKLFAVGVKRYWKNIFNKLDLLIMVLSIVSLAVFRAGDQQETLNRLRIMFFLRLMRTLRLLNRFRGVRVVLRTVGQISPLLWRFLIVLVISMYVLAIVGVEAFTGVLSPSNDAVRASAYGVNGQWALSFDTVTRSAMSVFSILVTTQSPIFIEGLMAGLNSWLPAAYFAAAYFALVVVVSNILIALLLQSYGISSAHMRHREARYVELWEHVLAVAQLELHAVAPDRFNRPLMFRFKRKNAFLTVNESLFGESLMLEFEAEADEAHAHGTAVSSSSAAAVAGADAAGNGGKGGIAAGAAADTADWGSGKSAASAAGQARVPTRLPVVAAVSRFFGHLLGSDPSAAARSVSKAGSAGAGARGTAAVPSCTLRVHSSFDPLAYFGLLHLQMRSSREASGMTSASGGGAFGPGGVPVWSPFEGMALQREDSTISDSAFDAVSVNGGAGPPPAATVAQKRADAHAAAAAHAAAMVQLQQAHAAAKPPTVFRSLTEFVQSSLVPSPDADIETFVAALPAVAPHLYSPPPASVAVGSSSGAYIPPAVAAYAAAPSSLSSLSRGRSALGPAAVTSSAAPVSPRSLSAAAPASPPRAAAPGDDGDSGSGSAVSTPSHGIAIPTSLSSAATTAAPISPGASSAAPPAAGPLTAAPAGAAASGPVGRTGRLRRIAELAAALAAEQAALRHEERRQALKPALGSSAAASEFLERAAAHAGVGGVAAAGSGRGLSRGASESASRGSSSSRLWGPAAAGVDRAGSERSAASGFSAFSTGAAVSGGAITSAAALVRQARSGSGLGLAMSAVALPPGAAAAGASAASGAGSADSGAPLRAGAVDDAHAMHQLHGEHHEHVDAVVSGADDGYHEGGSSDDGDDDDTPIGAHGAAAATGRLAHARAAARRRRGDRGGDRDDEADEALLVDSGARGQAGAGGYIVMPPDGASGAGVLAAVGSLARSLHSGFFAGLMRASSFSTNSGSNAGAGASDGASSGSAAAVPTSLSSRGPASRSRWAILGGSSAAAAAAGPAVDSAPAFSSAGGGGLSRAPSAPSTWSRLRGASDVVAAPADTRPLLDAEAPGAAGAADGLLRLGRRGTASSVDSAAGAGLHGLHLPSGSEDYAHAAHFDSDAGAGAGAAGLPPRPTRLRGAATAVRAAVRARTGTVLGADVQLAPIVHDPTTAASAGGEAMVVLRDGAVQLEE